LFNFSSGMSTTYPVRERFKVNAEATITNVLNHTKLGDLNINLRNPSFGLVLRLPVTIWGTREALAASPWMLIQRRGGTNASRP
jgi:hypothetical protein